MKAIKVVKVGGAILEDSGKLNDFIGKVAQIEGQKIIVHGGGREATALATKLGIESKLVNGRRITDAKTLEIVTMVYAGLVNKTVVAKLQSHGVNALGLTGTDGDLFSAVRRKPLDGIDYGFVGDIRNVNINLLKLLLSDGITPVVAPITHDGNGNLLNINADTVASEIACGLAKDYNVKLIYCFEKDGVMTLDNNETEVISLIDKTVFKQLVGDKIITDGMIPKVQNALNAVEKGVEEVIITNYKKLDDLSLGTHIKI